MKPLAVILAILLSIEITSAKDTLIEKPIELNQNNNSNLSNFYKKYISDVNIEDYIKKQLTGDFVPISLDECISVALKNNFDMKIKEHEFESSKYNYEYSLTKFLPDFNVKSYITHYAGQILVGGVLSDDFDEAAISASIGIIHNLTKGGEEIFKAKAAKYFKKAKKHEQNFTKTQTLYLTSKYYYEALLAKINIEIYLRNLIERNVQLEITKSQEKSGFGTHFDVIRSESEALDAKSVLLNSLSEFRSAQSQLAYIMGIDVKTMLMPFENEINELNLIPESKTLDNLIKEAVNNREDLKHYENLIKYEKQIKNTYVTEYIPKPYITFHQQFQGTVSTSVYPNYNLGAYLDWRPGEYLGIGTIKKIKQQKEKIRAEILKYQNKLRDIEEKIVSAYTASEFIKKQIAINEKRVKYANESIKLAMLRFNYGKGILLDIIQAQGETISAQVQYISSVINYNLAQLELLYESGAITKEEILKNYKP